MTQVMPCKPLRPRSWAAPKMRALSARFAPGLRPELQDIVAVGVLNGLAESGKPEAARILLAYSQPGTPERLRTRALSALPKFKEELQRSDAQAVARTVG